MSIERIGRFGPSVPLRHQFKPHPDSVHKPITGYAPPHPYHLQDPHCDRDHNHDIEDGLNARGHGDEVIDQLQRKADHDQGNDDVYQGHVFVRS